MNTPPPPSLPVSEGLPAGVSARANGGPVCPGGGKEDGSRKIPTLDNQKHPGLANLLQFCLLKLGVDGTRHAEEAWWGGVGAGRESPSLVGLGGGGDPPGRDSLLFFFFSSIFSLFSHI